jgi:hypothetical protein
MKCTLIALAALVTTTQAQVAFDPVFAQENLWALDQDAFQKATAGLPFEWTSSARDSARAGGYRGMTLFGRPVYELIARFDQNKLSEVSANFYARGDVGEITEPAFRQLLTGTVEAVTKACGATHTVRGKDAASAVKAEGLLWQTPKAGYLLEYSFTKEVKSRDIPFRAEFVRLEVRAPQQKQTLLAASLGTGKREKFNGPAQVKRDTASGDVFLPNVPMVDQGQKGYCVVASAERVMRYYGGDVDANELAQIANTGTEGGTSVTAMREAMKKVAARLKVKVREHETMEIKDILELLKDYNRSAKRAGAAEIPDQGYFLDMGLIYSQMKGDVLKEARTRNKADLGRFIRDVQAKVDVGIPLLWSVQLGLLPEKGIPQSAGGHMRLIIGYNLKTQEILYSDSWGAGHELKRLPAADAWTMTTQLMSIEPLG